MKWTLTILLLTGVLMSACGGTPSPDQDESERVTVTTTQTVQPAETSTPLPIGTWETVIDGMIFDRLTEPGKPIVGASISYNVLHSYFAELQEGRANSTLSDEFGGFKLTVIVHDTDSIKILIEAQDYISYEERFVGIDLFGGRSLNIGLSPLLTVTVSPP